MLVMFNIYVRLFYLHIHVCYVYFLQRENATNRLKILYAITGDVFLANDVSHTWMLDFDTSFHLTTTSLVSRLIGLGLFDEELPINALYFMLNS